MICYRLAIKSQDYLFFNRIDFANSLNNFLCESGGNLIKKYSFIEQQS